MMHSLTIKKNIAIIASSFYTIRNNDNYEFELVKNALLALSITQGIDFKKKYHTITQLTNRNWRDDYNIEISSVYNIHIENLHIVIVPGAMEIPQAINWLIHSNQKIDGMLALGCVIQGQTTHYDHVCNTAISGIAQIALQSKIPITNAIITAQNDDQAKERCFAEINERSAKNLGFHGMKSLVEIIELKHKINENSN